MLRYDARLADAPYSIHLVDPSVLDYTSDGSTGLEFLLWVTDVAGQNVTAGQTLCHCPMDDHGMFSKRQDLPRHEIESAFTVLLLTVFIVTVIMSIVVAVVVIFIVVSGNNACNICIAQCWCRSCPAISCFAAERRSNVPSYVCDQHKDPSQLDE